MTAPAVRQRAAAGFIPCGGTVRAGCAIARVRAELGRDYQAVIAGRECRTADRIVSVNPAGPAEVIGTVAAVDRELAEEAVAAARAVQPAWGAMSPAERAGSCSGRRR